MNTMRAATLAILVMVIGCKGVEQREAPKPKDEPTTSKSEKTKPKKKKEAPPEPKSVDAKTLLADYGANEVKGDERYKGKRLRLAGIVGDIKKDLDGVPFVTVGTGAELELPVAQCYFADGVEGLGDLKPKQPVKVDCTCDGVMMNVIMRECVFAPSEALAFCKKIEAAGVECEARDGHEARFKGKGSKTVGIVFHYDDPAIVDALVKKQAESKDKDKMNTVGARKAGIVVSWKSDSPAVDKKIRDEIAAL